MGKLLSANFARLRKDRFFWYLLAAVIIASLLNILNSARSFEVMTESGYGLTLEDYYFNQATLKVSTAPCLPACFSEPSIPMVPSATN